MSDHFWEMFRAVEADLWRAQRSINPDYSRMAIDCWVLCPRAHATAHLRCILELSPHAYPGLPGMLWLAKEQFTRAGRYHPGDDLVFAVGDSQ